VTSRTSIRITGGYLIGAIEDFKVLSAEELLIRNTEDRMVHGPPVDTETTPHFQALHTAGLISTKTVGELFGLELDEPAP
jgi:hypothetical protein